MVILLLFIPKVYLCFFKTTFPDKIDSILHTHPSPNKKNGKKKAEDRCVLCFDSLADQPSKLEYHTQWIVLTLSQRTGDAETNTR